MFKQVFPLSLIVSMRFFGLFLVLPVISVYALSLPNSSHQIVGIIIGGYALTQMIFQVPFGVMSDKLGRRGTITIGLLIFAIGSVVCALSDDIIGLLFGRLLQGAGAIGAVITASISDVVKEEKRPKAMAIMGGMIAGSFALAMVLGPILGGFFSISVLFWIVSFLAIVSVVILWTKVQIPPIIHNQYNQKTKYIQILLNPNLVRMNITNLLQKGLMMFAFMIIPIVLVKTFGWQTDELWKIYIPAMVAGIIAMAPASILAEKKGQFKAILLTGVAIFGVAYFVMGSSKTDTMFLFGVILFFIGFNMHEPIMQSLTTKYAKAHQRGLVLGIFNSFGYLGSFLGGLIGGIYLDKLGLEQISLVVVFISFIWFVLLWTLPNPRKIKNIYLQVKEDKKDHYGTLLQKDGIDEWYINISENLLVVRYNESLISKDSITKSLL